MTMRMYIGLDYQCLFTVCVLISAGLLLLLLVVIEGGADST